MPIVERSFCNTWSNTSRPAHIECLHASWTHSVGCYPANPVSSLLYGCPIDDPLFKWWQSAMASRVATSHAAGDHAKRIKFVSCSRLSCPLVIVVLLEPAAGARTKNCHAHKS